MLRRHFLYTRQSRQWCRLPCTGRSTEGKNRQRLDPSRLYLPDVRKGYYRATRFDWSGVVGSLKFKGHEITVGGSRSTTPLNHDSITDP